MGGPEGGSAMIETRKWARPLTDDELAKILAGIASAEDAYGALTAAMIGVFDVALRDEGSSWEAAESITPWDYALPVEQWHAIGEALTARTDRSDIGRVNLLLDWMNKGPSSYGGE
jgi:hypothetical protein